MMRSLWKRFCYRPAIGLVIDQQQIAMSIVASTPLGRREIARDLQECDGESTEAVLQRMLQPWLPVAGGIASPARPLDPGRSA